MFHGVPQFWCRIFTSTGVLHHFFTPFTFQVSFSVHYCSLLLFIAAVTVLKLQSVIQTTFCVSLRETLEIQSSFCVVVFIWTSHITLCSSSHNRHIQIMGWWSSIGEEQQHQNLSIPPSLPPLSKSWLIQQADTVHTHTQNSNSGILILE